ncbi:MAG: N-acetylmuramoyl-L-alanine amidase [Spirochaetales bacterium]|nr:N-acetylmuramoyl-L-alanine amidase [Spirochaetales bacterium]
MEKRIFALILAIFTIFSLQANAESLLKIEDFLKSYDVEFFWDDFRQVGLIRTGSQTITFKAGFDYFLLNYSQKRFCGGITLDGDGRILLSQEAQGSFSEILQPYKINPNVMKIAAIVIDPGHGGFDSGAVSPFDVGGSRLMEKDVVLAISLLLDKKLKEKYPEKRIEMTRSTDIFIELEKRTEIANNIKIKKNEAIIFISIHANASPFRPNAEGFEVWCNPEDKTKKMMTEDMKKDIPKQALSIFEMLLQEEINTETKILASNILKGLEDALGANIPNRGLKENDWAVVMNARMPAVLVEVGFLTHKKEAERLKNNQYLEKLADGIFKGLVTFVDTFESTNGFTGGQVE